MTSFLVEQLFASLANAVHHPDVTLLHPKKQPVDVSLPKNLRRVQKLRKTKAKQPINVTTVLAKTTALSQTISNAPSLELIDAIAQEISLARNIAHELYVAEELSRAEWISTKHLLKQLSSQLVQKKEHYLS